MSNLVTTSRTAIVIVAVALAAALVWILAAVGAGSSGVTPQVADDTMVFVDGVEVAWDDVNPKVDVDDIVFVADNG